MLDCYIRRLSIRSTAAGQGSEPFELEVCAFIKKDRIPLSGPCRPRYLSYPSILPPIPALAYCHPLIPSGSGIRPQRAQSLPKSGRPASSITLLAQLRVTPTQLPSFPLGRGLTRDPAMRG